MHIDHAVKLVVADQRYHRHRTIKALDAIKHVRNTYTLDTVNARIAEGTIADMDVWQAYHDVLAADGYELGMLFAAWAPARRPGCSLWIVLPVIVVVIVVLTALF